MVVRRDADQFDQRRRRVPSAGPGYAAGNTRLKTLGCVHAVETDRGAVDLEGIAVDHRGRAGGVGEGGDGDEEHDEDERPAHE